MSGLTPDETPRGVYLLGNDPYVEWLEALVVSLRHHDPRLPIMIVPYDDRCEGLRRAAATWGCSFWSDEDALRLADDVAGDVMPSDGFGQGMLRKLVCFWGPFTRFAYLDADCLTTGTLAPAFDELDNHDVLFATRSLPEYVYRSGPLRAWADAHPEAVFNAGVFLSHRDRVTRDQVRRMAATARPEVEHFTPLGDQPFLNFLVRELGLRASDLPASGPMMAWAADELTASSPMSLSGPDGRTVAAVHWAGFRLGPAMPLRGLWRRYRYLQEPRWRGQVAAVVDALAGPPARAWRGLRYRLGTARARWRAP